MPSRSEYAVEWILETFPSANAFSSARATQKIPRLVFIHSRPASSSRIWWMTSSKSPSFGADPNDRGLRRAPAIAPRARIESRQAASLGADPEPPISILI